MPIVPLKVAIASLELHLGTIPGRVGPGGSGPIVILRLPQSSCAGAGTELGNMQLSQGKILRNCYSKLLIFIRDVFFVSVTI